MKINTITVKNILAIQSAEIETKKAIIFVSGNNESGKSSIRDAVSMALTGDLCRVSLKKEASWLINDEIGMVEVRSGENSFFTQIDKSGITRGKIIDPVDTLTYVLDPSKFAAASTDQRRQLLFDISGCDASVEVVMKRLVELGCVEKMASQILPLLRVGFPEARAEAQNKAREAKAAWRAVTGEAYGEKKAEKWKPVVIGDVDDARDQVIYKQKALVDINNDLEQLNQKYGALKARADKLKGNQSEIDLLREQASRIERITIKLKKDEQELEDWSEKFEKAKLETHGISKNDTALHCPECHAELIFLSKEKKLVSHGDLRGSEEAAAELPKFERMKMMFIGSVANDKRDLAEAIRAKDRLAEIEANAGVEIDDFEIEQIKEALNIKRSERKEMEDIVRKLIAFEHELNQADEKTAKAMDHHTKVLEWEKIADALAPEGIPGEILKKAINPFNNRMREQAFNASWKRVWLNDDMEIMVEQLPYAIMSESAKWRADTLLTEAISHVSGLKLLVLDRMDVLDGKSRVGLFVWLHELAGKNEIDTALVMGTMKPEQAESVSNAFDSVSVHWMSEGVLEEVLASKDKKGVAA